MNDETKKDNKCNKHEEMKEESKEVEMKQNEAEGTV